MVVWGRFLGSCPVSAAWTQMQRRRLGFKNEGLGFKGVYKGFLGCLGFLRCLGFLGL